MQATQGAGYEWAHLRVLRRERAVPNSTGGVRTEARSQAPWASHLLERISDSVSNPNRRGVEGSIISNGGWARAYLGDERILRAE